MLVPRTFLPARRLGPRRRWQEADSMRSHCAADDRWRIISPEGPGTKSCPSSIRSTGRFLRECDCFVLRSFVLRVSVPVLRESAPVLRILGLPLLARFPVPPSCSLFSLCFLLRPRFLPTSPLLSRPSFLSPPPSSLHFQATPIQSASCSAQASARRQYQYYGGRFRYYIAVLGAGV